MGFAAPLVLGSQLTITRGQLLRFSSADLAPKVLVPYEINSIRMVAYPAIEVESVVAGPTTALRGFLKWQFMVGNFLPLTDHFVPMWNMMPIRQTITESGGYYEWRFKKPMLISPGGRIDAQVQLQTNAPNPGVTPITVAVSYAGMLRGDLNSLPAYTDVPFCSCWDTTVAGNQGLANDSNTLRNPLKTTVDVHSLIARIQSDTTGRDGDDSTELQIFDPWGRALNRLGTIQFHAMFPTDTREFPYSGQLLQDQHFAVRLTTPPSATYRPMISYLGSRRERLP
jgi:hypothetical protein